MRIARSMLVLKCMRDIKSHDSRYKTNINCLQHEKKLHPQMFYFISVSHTMFTFTSAGRQQNTGVSDLCSLWYFLCFQDKFLSDSFAEIRSKKLSGTLTPFQVIPLYIA